MTSFDEQSSQNFGERPSILAPIMYHRDSSRFGESSTISPNSSAIVDRSELKLTSS